MGNRAAGKVPDAIFPAFVVSTEQDAAAPAKSLQDGCDACGAPEFEMLSSQLWAAGARLSIPPKLLELGSGRSAPTMARGAIAPPEPLGEARNRFAACDAPLTAKVPAAVIGEPETASHDGIASPTLETVPAGLPPSRICPDPAQAATSPAVTEPDWATPPLLPLPGPY